MRNVITLVMVLMIVAVWFLTHPLGSDKHLSTTSTIITFILFFGIGSIAFKISSQKSS